VIGVALVALLVVVAGILAFATVVAGIRASERRSGLPGPTSGPADAFARRILCPHQVDPSPIVSQRTARQASYVRSGR
jgi:hypothetical protein